MQHYIGVRLLYRVTVFDQDGVCICSYVILDMILKMSYNPCNGDIYILQCYDSSVDKHTMTTEVETASVIIMSVVYPLKYPSNACLSYLDNGFGCLTGKHVCVFTNKTSK